MQTKANKKKRGLGKGLESLMGDGAESIINDAIAKGNAQELPINVLQASVGQPRTTFSDEALESLSQSISQHGVLQPLLVREIGINTYEIVAGERRYRASQKSGLKTLPVVIMSLTDTEASEISLVENIQREDLNALEESLGYNRMMHEFGYTQEMLSKTIGKSRSHIANTLRLLTLGADVKSLVEKGDLSAGHARTLIGIEFAYAYDLAMEIIQQGMSVREAEKLVSSHKNANNEKYTTNKPVAKKLSGEEEIVKQILEKNTGLSAKVKITKNGSGQITLSFESEKELRDLLYKLQ